MVAAAAVLCFINIVPNEFCFDDVPIVRDNPKVQAPGQWNAIWTTDYWFNSGQDATRRDLLYRPVTLSLFRATRIAAGASPIPFHIVSLLLHALCSVLVALLVARLMQNPAEGAQEGKPGGESPRNRREIVPLAAGLLFAVLPIHSEVVASVVGQADLLATAGTLGAILCHFRVVHATSIRHAVTWILAAAACAFAAMGAKENGISVVPLVLLAALLGLPTITRRQSHFPTSPLLDKEGEGGGQNTLRARLMLLAQTTYLLAPLIAYLALRYYALGGALHQAPAPTKTVNVLVDAPPWQHALGVLQAWGMYWVKTIFPRELCIEYAINSVRLTTSLWQFHLLVGLLWGIALLTLAWLGWRQGRKGLVFLVAALGISYLPTSNAIVLIQVFFAERIWYLPSAFLVALIALGATRLLERRTWRFVGLAMLAGMMVRCWVRNSDWRNNGTLFAATYQDHPHSVMARHLYGQWLTQNGELERGAAIIRKALEIDLGFTDAHRSLGRAYLAGGQFEDALRHLQIADMQVPGHPQTQDALARAVEELRRSHAPELQRRQQAARDNPDDESAQLDYVRFLRSIGQTRQALGLLEAGAMKYARSADWAAETAVTLVYLDRRDEAINRYRKAVQMGGDRAQLKVEAAMLLIERRGHGDIDEARVLVESAIAQEPQSANVHAALGEVKALQGDIAGARDSYRKALSLTPPGSNYARILTERAKSLGQ